LTGHSNADSLMHNITKKEIKMILHEQIITISRGIDAMIN